MTMDRMDNIYRSIVRVNQQGRRTAKEKEALRKLKGMVGRLGDYPSDYEYLCAVEDILNGVHPDNSAGLRSVMGLDPLIGQ